jgi:hypothetical protein
MYLVNQCRKGVLYVVDTLAIGIDPEYNLGDGYRMSKPFGYIVKIDEYGEAETITDGGNISQFAFFNDWLIGKDEKGYFAVNRKTNACDYPIDSIDNLEKIIGQSTQPINWITDYRKMEPYIIKSRETKVIKFILNIVSGAIVFLLVGLLFLYGKKKNYFKWNGSEKSNS